MAEIAPPRSTTSLVPVCMPRLSFVSPAFAGYKLRPEVAEFLALSLFGFATDEGRVHIFVLLGAGHAYDGAVVVRVLHYQRQAPAGCQEPS
uniref:Transposase n=1 Tax=Ascaris lumbricoides TaxID=6252 RepID=A0A0M3IMF9_ASCLU